MNQQEKTDKWQAGIGGQWISTKETGKNKNDNQSRRFVLEAKHKSQTADGCQAQYPIEHCRTVIQDQEIWKKMEEGTVGPIFEDAFIAEDFFGPWDKMQKMNKEINTKNDPI